VPTLRGGWLAQSRGPPALVRCIPTLYGYAAIVYSDAVYRPYLPRLAKLFIYSSVVHQCCFSLFSSLPYAVGQASVRARPQVGGNGS
jgi:hypothetical protein